MQSAGFQLQTQRCWMQYEFLKTWIQTQEGKSQSTTHEERIGSQDNQWKGRASRSRLGSDVWIEPGVAGLDGVSKVMMGGRNCPFETQPQQG